MGSGPLAPVQAQLAAGSQQHQVVHQHPELRSKHLMSPPHHAPRMLKQEVRIAMKEKGKTGLCFNG